MITSTRHLVVSFLCSKIHRQTVSMQSIDTINLVYAGAFWSNTPEEKGPG